MSRSIRDLRDIVNISRLSIRDECSSDYSSDSGSASDSDELNDYISNRPSSARVKSTFATPFIARPSSEMGARRRTALPSQCDARPQTAPVHHDGDTVHHRDCSNNDSDGKHSSAHSKLQTFPSKYTPIPPIGKSSETKRNVSVNSKKCENSVNGVDDSSTNKNTVCLTYCDDSQVVHINNDERVKLPKDKQYQQAKNFDELFQYLDGTIIASWLEKCNEKLSFVDNFMKVDDNFTKFAQFILSDVPSAEYSELMDLEFSILIDHLKYGFHSGFSDGSINVFELEVLAKSVVWEYHSKLKKRNRGPKLLLDIIVTFCSGRTDVYRRLLKDIHCHSYNKQNVQWLLSIRAFGLISLISGILKFYEKASYLKDKVVNEERRCADNDDDGQLHLNTLIIQAVCYGYLDVLDYFYTNHKVDFSTITDEKGRNLISIGVCARQYEALCYLLKLPVEMDVNEKWGNGSTPVHCAVTYNDLKLTSILLEHGGNVNAWNEEADGATALHIAVMLGNVDMVKLLLHRGADKTSVMGVPAHITALSLARDMDHLHIVQVLNDTA